MGRHQKHGDMGKEGIEIASGKAGIIRDVFAEVDLVPQRAGPLHLANTYTSGIILAFSHLHILLHVPLSYRVHSAFPNDASMSHVLS